MERRSWGTYVTMKNLDFFKKIFIQFLKVTFHLLLLQNVS